MGKASRNPTKKPYKVRIAEKQQEIDEEQAEEDRFCWNLVIGCLISVAVCFFGEYLHKRPYIIAQQSVDMAQVAFEEGRWSDCIDHYTEVIDAGYALMMVMMMMRQQGQGLSLAELVAPREPTQSAAQGQAPV